LKFGHSFTHSKWQFLQELQLLVLLHELPAFLETRGLITNTVNRNLCFWLRISHTERCLTKWKFQVRVLEDIWIRS